MSEELREAVLHGPAVEKSSCTLHNQFNRAETNLEL